MASRKLPKNIFFVYLIFNIFLLGAGCTSLMKLGGYPRKVKYTDMRFKATMDDLALASFLSPLTPILLVDLPFSLATDIVMFPMDQFFYTVYVSSREKKMELEKNKRNKADEYWKEVFKTGNIQAEEARPHLQYLNQYDYPTWQSIWDKVLSPYMIFDLILEVSFINNVYVHFPSIARTPRLREDQYERLYHAVLSLPNVNKAAIMVNLAQNPSISDKLLLDIAATDIVRTWEFIHIPNNRSLNQRGIAFSTVKERFPEPVLASELVRYFVAFSLDTPPDMLAKLANDINPVVVWAVASNINTPPSVLETLATNSSQIVKARVAKNPSNPTNKLSGEAKGAK